MKMEEALVENELVDCFRHDWEDLTGDVTATTTTRTAIDDVTPGVYSLRLLSSLSDLTLGTSSSATAVHWHPQASDLVGVSLLWRDGNRKDPTVLSVGGRVLLWSLPTPLLPQVSHLFNGINRSMMGTPIICTCSCRRKLALEAEAGVEKFKFSRTDPDLVVGGLENGRCVLWDLQGKWKTAKKTSSSDPLHPSLHFLVRLHYTTHNSTVVTRQIVTQPEKSELLLPISHRGSPRRLDDSSRLRPSFEFRGLMKRGEEKDDGIESLKPIRISHVKSSHVGPIRELFFVPSTVQFEGRFRLQRRGKAGRDQLRQFVTLSRDGWDLRLWEVRGERRFLHLRNQVRFLDPRKRPVSSIVAVYFLGFPTPSQVKMEEEKAEKKNEEDEDEDEEDGGTQEGKGLQDDLNGTVFWFTSDGFVYRGDLWASREDDQGNILMNAEEQMSIGCPCVEVRPHPHIKSLFLILSVWKVLLWKPEGVIWESGYGEGDEMGEFRDGRWSYGDSRLFFLASSTGRIEAWNVVHHHGRPLTSTQPTCRPLNGLLLPPLSGEGVVDKYCICPGVLLGLGLGGGDGTRLACGDESGSLHVLRLSPSVLSHPSQHYVEEEEKRRESALQAQRDEKRKEDKWLKAQSIITRDSKLESLMQMILEAQSLMIGSIQSSSDHLARPLD
ncbi:unnamed protein product [Darwinula stevensoni]|uniref:Uncharacterized protein n=1 Tax=Darwinula stevensoni TaxID=69355 RepID=A0A7R9A234_9CRUS|nr:unnamed protein product [Darwinula stevensoni]CAG0884845.1 unnamed protein product [Darwinula stevensoni]